MRTIRTAKKRAALLSAISECGGNITRACKRAGIGRNAIYEWRGDAPQFKVEYDSAVDRCIDTLEDEARRRAFEGVKKPVYYSGKKIGVISEYSDTLLIFLLKAGRPERYRARSTADLNVKSDLAERIIAGRKRVGKG
jgi:hypothetical protein